MSKQITYALDNGVHEAVVSEGGDVTRRFSGLNGQITAPDGKLVRDYAGGLIRYNTWDGFDASIEDFKRVVKALANRELSWMTV